MNERGVTLLELLVAVALGTLVLLGVGALYMTAAWSSKGDSEQAYLQNQATLVIAELTRQVEAASTIQWCFSGSDCLLDPPTCDGADNFLFVSQSDGSIYCFYKDTNGRFMEYREPCATCSGGGSSGSWNMLAGSQTPLKVTSLDFSGTGDTMMNANFQLQATGATGASGPTGLGGGASADPTMTFAMGIAKR